MHARLATHGRRADVFSSTDHRRRRIAGVSPTGGRRPPLRRAWGACLAAWALWPNLAGATATPERLQPQRTAPLVAEGGPSALRFVHGAGTWVAVDDRSVWICWSGSPSASPERAALGRSGVAGAQPASAHASAARDVADCFEEYPLDLVGVGVGARWSVVFDGSGRVLLTPDGVDALSFEVGRGAVDWVPLEAWWEPDEGSRRPCDDDGWVPKREGRDFVWVRQLCPQAEPCAQREPTAPGNRETRRRRGAAFRLRVGVGLEQRAAAVRRRSAFAPPDRPLGPTHDTASDLPTPTAARAQSYEQRAWLRLSFAFDPLRAAQLLRPTPRPAPEPAYAGELSPGLFSSSYERAMRRVACGRVG